MDDNKVRQMMKEHGIGMRTYRGVWFIYWGLRNVEYRRYTRQAAWYCVLYCLGLPIPPD